MLGTDGGDHVSKSVVFDLMISHVDKRARNIEINMTKIDRINAWAVPYSYKIEHSLE